MSDSREYTEVITAFHKGPAGSGWSISLVDDEGSGFGINLNYHKVGSPNQNLYEEKMSLRQIIELKRFCEQAINALASPKQGE